MARTLSLILAAILTLASIPALAQEVRPGTYAGVMTDRDRYIPVFLTLESNGGGSVRLGQPMMCTLKLRYVGPRPQGQVYALPSSNGGFCDRLMGGNAEVTAQRDRIELGLIDPSQKRLQPIVMTVRE